MQNIFFELPLELQFYIISFVPIKTFCLLMYTNKYFNNLCDKIIGLNINYKNNKEYFNQKRNHFVKYLEKQDKIDEVFNVIYQYSFSIEKRVTDTLYNKTKVDNELKKIFNYWHKINKPISHMNSSINDLIKIEKNICDNKKLNKRIKILKKYKKMLSKEFYQKNVIIKYIKTLIKNYEIPDIEGYRYGNIKKLLKELNKNLKNLFNIPNIRAKYNGLTKITLHDICENCIDYIDDPSSNKISLYPKININIIGLCSLFRLNTECPSPTNVLYIKHFYYEKYETKFMINIKQEYNKLNPNKKIESVNGECCFDEFVYNKKNIYKISDLCQLVTIFGVCAIKQIEQDKIELPELIKDLDKKKDYDDYWFGFS